MAYIDMSLKTVVRFTVMPGNVTIGVFRRSHGVEVCVLGEDGQGRAREPQDYLFLIDDAGNVTVFDHQPFTIQVEGA